MVNEIKHQTLPLGSSNKVYPENLSVMYSIPLVGDERQDSQDRVFLRPAYLVVMQMKIDHSHYGPASLQT